MFSQALADAKKHLPECLVITTIVMVIREVTDYKGFYPITWLIVIALTTFLNPSPLAVTHVIVTTHR